MTIGARVLGGEWETVIRVLRRVDTNGPPPPQGSSSPGL